MQATSPVSALDDDARFPARRRCTLLPAGDDSAGPARSSATGLSPADTSGEKRGTRRRVRPVRGPWRRRPGPGTVTSRMPELPELEALVRAMDEPVAASPVAGPPEAHFAVLKTADPPLASLAGQRLTGALRRGKYLLFPADDGATLAVHLMSGGRIGYAGPGEKKPGNAVLTRRLRGRRGARWSPRRGAARTCGCTSCATTASRSSWTASAPSRSSRSSTARPSTPSWTPGRASSTACCATSARWPASAGRSPTRSCTWRSSRRSRSRTASTTRRAAAPRRHRARCSVRRCWPAPSRARGCPPKNDARPLQIHGHDGEPCPRCGTTLRFVDFESNRIVYCPPCQTAGRELADRRLSKLLR